MMFSISLLLGLGFSSSVIYAHVSPLRLQRRQTNSTASDILNKGIEALGGEEALKALKTVTYNGQYVSPSSQP